MTRLSRTLRHPIRTRGPVAALLAFVVAVMGVLPGMPEAKAATTFGDCSFRTSSTTAPTYALSRQLCWIDFSGVDFSTTAGRQITKQVGAYTLSMTLSIVGRPQSGVASAQAGPLGSTVPFGNTIGGVSNFIGGSGKQIIEHNNNADGASGYRNMLRFTFSNITLTDTRTNTAVGSYQFDVADAETTQSNEGISIDNGDGTYTAPPVTYFTPSGYTRACGGMSGSGKEYVPIVLAPDMSWQQRDFVCQSNFGDLSKQGSFVARLDSPKQFTVSTYTLAQQAFAVAINLGQAGGTVSADTTAYASSTAASHQEKAATGAESQFDLKAWNDVSGSTNPFLQVPIAGGTAIGPQDGSLTSYLRNFGGTAQGSDTLYFQSSAQNTPGGVANALLRYQPNWTCYQSYGLADQTTVALTPDSTASQTATSTGSTVTYKTVNDAANGTSQVQITNPDNLPIQCNVYWKSRFQVSTLNLSKIVGGTAQGFPEVQNRQYYLNYACTDASFAAAYSSSVLNGQITIGRNASTQVLTLPQGAVCTFTETFPNNEAPALPGKRMTLTWGGNASGGGSWDSIDHPEIYPPASPTVANPNLPGAAVTLGATSNVQATNQFDYRGGTVSVSKTIQGDPVKELANTTKTYQFSWSCANTDKSGTFSLTVTYDAAGVPTDPKYPTGTASGSAPQISDVPVERDCTLTPLTGLSTDQSARINFDGRSVDVEGDTNSPGVTPADGNGAYHFRIKDYRDTDGAVITSTNASHVTITIVTSYSYKTADLKLVKRLAGAGAAQAAKEFGTFTTFPVSYSCTYGNNETVQGTATATTDTANPTVVKAIPLGAQCKVWENVATAPQGTNVQLVQRDANNKAATTVTGTDASDAATTLDNDTAQNTPVLTMHQSTNTGANTALIANTYVSRLGTVSLQKQVNTNGISQTLPNSFTFSFDCGQRPVTQNGSTVSVALTGTATVAGGQVVNLVANPGDATQAGLVNDGAGGVMQVPYGNTCSFNENPVTGLPTGITVTSDASAATFTVGAPATTRTVTNTFNAAGQGLTISQSFATHPELAPSAGITYAVSCDNNYSTTITLTAAAPSQTIAASSVPEGVHCTVTEPTADPGTRSGQNGSYPIVRTTTASVPADGSNPAVSQTFTTTNGVVAPVSVTLTVGSATVLSLSHAYDFVYKDVDAQKVVAFDSATQQWISDARKQVANNRVFTINLTCTQPNGSTENASLQLSAANTSLAGTSLLVDNLPVGSTCTATEAPSSFPAGITLTVQAGFNGSSATSTSVGFTVANGTNELTFTNTYARQLATVQLNKIAVFPANVDSAIRNLYGSNLNSYLHNHNFTLDCRDPAANEAPLGSLTGSIKGEGTYTFTGVPVGTDCHIRGDNFTQLDLTTTRADGVQLESHFYTAKVDWVVDKNDGTTYTDSPINNGITNSNYVTILPNGSDGSIGNVVDLKNNYQFVMTNIDRQKKVQATQQGWDLLRQSNPTYSFTYRCSGVGFDDWTISNADQIPSSLTLNQDLAGTPTSNGDTPETFTATYTSPTYQVPAGSWCVATELPATNTPAQLQLTTEAVDASGNVVPASTLAHRAPGGSEASSADYTFINSYSRRMVPVRLVLAQDGFWQGAQGNYVANVVCTDPAGTTATRTVPVANAVTGQVVSASSPPQTGGGIYLLPADATCTLTMSGQALAARPELEVTQGTRTPFVEYGLWDASGKAYAPNPAEASNPTLSPGDTTAADVTPAMKDNQLSFTIAADAASPGGNAPALTVSAEAEHLQDQVTMTLTKRAVGSVADGATFQFSSTCASGPITLRAGQEVTLPNVKVDTQCNFTETDDGVANSEATLSVDAGATGSNVAVASVVNQNATPAQGNDPAQPGQHSVTVNVLPVSDASSTATDGSAWQLALVNSYPSVSVTKTVAGPTLLGSPTTAVLPSDATSMQVTYDVTNSGGQTLTGFGITDPSLAGRTLTRNGVTYVVPSDGTITPAFCGLDGASLATGAEQACTFTVALTEATPGYVRIAPGPVTVTASAEGTPVSASASFGAIRPVVGILPTTGVQTMVWVLVLGVLVLAAGVWRSRRREDKDIVIDLTRGE